MKLSISGLNDAPLISKLSFFFSSSLSWQFIHGLCDRAAPQWNRHAEYCPEKKHSGGVRKSGIYVEGEEAYRTQNDLLSGSSLVFSAHNLLFAEFIRFVVRFVVCRWFVSCKLCVFLSRARRIIYRWFIMKVWRSMVQYLPRMDQRQYYQTLYTTMAFYPDLNCTNFSGNPRWEVQSIALWGFV